MDGMRHGNGQLTYKNGSIYTGHWQRGMKWGEGKMTYASGNFYEGKWANNKRNGFGTMHWLTTEEKYEGNWEDNFQSGFGAHIWLDGSTENKLLRNRYVGYWKLGQRQGKGVFYYSNGSKYEGDWFENFKHGTGIFTFEDGTSYSGPFDNDRMTNRQIEVRNSTEDLVPTRQRSKEPKKDDQNKKTASKGATSDKGKKESIKESKAHNSVSGAAAAKIAAAQRAKKEVEDNPYKKLIDISDLIEFESNPAECLKEVQNILLRHNSDLKQWYKVYSRKFDVVKSENSFSMTMKQLWRFLRDTNMISSNATIAQFNRIFNQGSKNHFVLLDSQSNEKFDSIYLNTGRQEKKAENENKSNNISDDEDEEETKEEVQNAFQESVHDCQKIVLQRQFFEAVVRATAAKFSSGSGREGLDNLALQLEHVFNNNFIPLAIKNKKKSVEDDKALKQALMVLQDFQQPLTDVFNQFSGKGKHSLNGKKDMTIQVHQILDMLTKANFFDGTTTDIKVEEVIFMIEKYYDPANTLKSKLEPERFEDYLAGNPELAAEQAQQSARRSEAMAHHQESQQNLNSQEQLGSPDLVKETGNEGQRDE